MAVMSNEAATNPFSDISEDEKPEPDTSALSELLKSADIVEVQLLPQKKGYIVKHVEYCVTSKRFKSQVIKEINYTCIELLENYTYTAILIKFQVARRFSDFVTLSEQLALRYPYRLIPRLPPQKLTAYYQGTYYLI